MSDDLSSQTGILIGIALTVAFALLVVFGLESKCERQHNVADCRPSITFEAVEPSSE